MTPLFRLEGVRLRRGDADVLHGVTGELPEGTSCVWGRSGAGKSTLLRLLNRLVDPTEGRVLFRGEDVRSLDPLALRRRVTLVAQLPAIVAPTVAGNLEYAARLAHRPVEVARLLRLVGLDAELAGADASRLSVGQQQRVMLARALALEPEVLLLDEPTASLDDGARDAVEAALGRLHGELGLSYVVVTHDREQAPRLADWLLELEAGRLVRTGAASELLEV